MTEHYDFLHLGGPDRNVEYLGTFVAWLVINNLLDPQVEMAAGNATARVRMHDMTGSAFLTTILHGDFGPAQLNDAGRRFVEQYFVAGTYRADYDGRDYQGDDEWMLYNELAPGITAAFRRLQTPASPRRTARILKFPGRRS